jgi:acyl-CoA synthetase (NDP forming)
MSLSLERLIRPRSVAIVGASEKPGALGASVLANLERAGFRGDIHLINPKRAEIGGRYCLASVDDLPEGVDAAVLAIPRAAVLETVRALARRKAGAAIIFSAGFAETGADGLAEQRELARTAAEADMAIEGPNCLGLVNFVDGVPLTFVELPGDRLGARPGIGLVSQSGAMAAVLAVTLASRGLGLSYSISTGNEAASGVEDYVDFLIDDPHTQVIAMIVEQFRKPARFLAAAMRAAAMRKPIVLLHPGRSSAARESAATHTGALAGDYDVMRLKVERAGVLLVETLEELGDVAEMLLRLPAPAPGGAAVVCESGAYKALTLDLAEREGLPLPPLGNADSPGLRAALPDFVPVSNPLDVTAQGLVDPDLYARVLAALIADDRIESVLLAIIQTDSVTAKLKFPPILAAIETLRPAKRVVFAGLDEGAAVPPDYVDRLRALNVPYFPSAERAVRALARLGRWHGAVSPSPMPQPAKTAAFAGFAGVIPEWRAKLALASIGIPFPQGALATTLAEAAAIAARIGYPVAIKAQSAELAHKSDAGGVIVGLRDEAALKDGWAKLKDNVGRSRPGLALDGVLIEAMGAPGVELIIGGRNDPEWGPVVVVGFGGVQAEILKDSRLLAPDMNESEILAELKSLKGAALFEGFRGSPPLDLQAVVRIVRAIGFLLLDEPSVGEIDLNPVVLYPRGEGAVALDALIIASFVETKPKQAFNEFT